MRTVRQGEGHLASGYRYRPATSADFPESVPSVGLLGGGARLLLWLTADPPWGGEAAEADEENAAAAMWDQTCRAG